MLWPRRSSSQARLLCFQLLRRSPRPGRDDPRAPRLFVCGQVTEATAAPPIDGWGTRPQAFGRMSAPALARFVPGPVLHRRAARRRIAVHRQVTGRACRASHHKSWEPAATRGDSALARRAPQATRTRPGGQTATVPKGRHDNHRPAPCCCYTPVPPRWFSRPCPAPGMTQLQNACLDRPAFVARSVCAAEGAPGHGRFGGVARACLRTSPGPCSPGSSAAGWSG
jgi:hypothetical protein